MKLILLIAASGILLFFPLNISGSTCLFAYLTGLHFSSGADPSTAMLNHYMRCFALPWWGSIALTMGCYKLIQRKKRTLTTKEPFNA